MASTCETGNRTVQNSSLTKIHTILSDYGFFLLKNEYHHVCYECMYTGKHVNIDIIPNGDVITIIVPLSDKSSYYKTTITGYTNSENYLTNYFSAMNVGGEGDVDNEDVDKDAPEIGCEGVRRRNLRAHPNVDVSIGVEAVGSDDEDSDVSVNSMDNYVVMDPIDIYRTYYTGNSIRNWHGIVISFFYINFLTLLTLKWKLLMGLFYFMVYIHSAKEIFRPCTYLIVSHFSSCIIPYPISLGIFLLKMLTIWTLNIAVHGIIIKDYPKLMGNTIISIIWAPCIVAMHWFPKYSTLMKLHTRYFLGPPYYLEDMVSKEDILDVLGDSDSD